ncbi:MAG: hypothetical protein JW839_01590 [Candidatus Lokiarchaeota archaeon]|nr:hypothetical protein [Candidatus Lokiarchaeota archaeon]
MDKGGFVRFLSGAFPARYALPYLATVYATFICLIIVSDLLYPVDYNFFSNSVSNLGDPLLNTFPGWLFFSLGLWSFGFLAMPLFLYQARGLKAGQRHFAAVFLVLSTAACAGSIGVGIFSEVAETVVAHVISAVVAFGGLFLAAIASWVPCFVGAARARLKRLRVLRLAISTVQLATVAITVAATVVVYVREEVFGIVGAGFLSVTFWEWMLLFCLGIHTFLLTVNVNLGMT